jgi:hypothetical protein
LQTLTIASPALIEVYPHPALVELAGAVERLPYKAAKVSAYWPKLHRHSDGSVFINNGAESSPCWNAKSPA